MADGSTQKCWKCGKADHNTTECSASEKLCFRCQEPGHMASTCSNPHKNIICRRCREKGHLSGDCTNKHKWHCENCASSGHVQWECPKPRGYLKMTCHLCQEIGHIAKECSNRTKWKCTNCNVTGHRQQDCPKPRGFLRRKCYHCGEVGHVSQECPNRMCFKCGGLGHMHKLCTNPPRSKVICYKCGSTGHLTRICPVPNRQTSAQETEPQASGTYPKCDQTRSSQSQPRRYVRKSPGESYPAQNGSASNFDGGSKKNYTAASHNSGTTSGTEKSSESMDRACLLNNQGTVAYGSQQYDNAIALFCEAISYDPTVASYYTNRGTAYAQLGKYSVALGDFEIAASMKTYRATAKVLVHTARCRFFLGSPSSALLALRDALSLDPLNAKAKALKGRVIELEGHISGYQGSRSRKHWHSAKNSYESCAKVYEQENGAVPIDVRCWGIELLIIERKWDEAWACVGDLLYHEPGATEAMVLLALVLFLTARVSEAISELVRVLKLDPDNHRAKALRTRFRDVLELKENGDALFRASNWSDAVSKWTSALQLVAENEEEGCGGIMRARLLLNRGVALGKIERHPEALKDINRSLDLSPKNFKAFRARGRIYAKLELYDSAQEDLKSALENMTDSKDLRALTDELSVIEQEVAKRSREGKDYYKILGLSRFCTKAEIKKAYRAESLKHHPDKGGIPEQFKLIAEAYTTLSDNASRQSYDSQYSHAPSYTFGSSNYF